MNTAVSVDSSEQHLGHKPGAELASIRSQRGYTTEYVAGKLHLRIHLIELLEADDYDKMPEPVFIKGYLRAYAKLLEISPEPLIERFNRYHATERRVERALWQSKKRSYKTYKAENTVRWVTMSMTFLVLTAVIMWWSKTKDTEQLETSTEVSQLRVKVTQAADLETVSPKDNVAVISSSLPSIETTTSVENLSE